MGQGINLYASTHSKLKFAPLKYSLDEVRTGLNKLTLKYFSHLYSTLLLAFSFFQ